MIGLRPRGRLASGAALLALLAPAPVASVEGPGYGGTADEVTVRWQGGEGGLTVEAAGFRAGSPVVLRVGSTPARTVQADPAGVLRVLVVRPGSGAARPDAGTVTVPVDTGADRLASGTTVQTTGRNPAGAVRTLVGAVPPPPAGNGVQDAVPWVALAALLLLGSGLLPTPVLHAVRRYRYPARHRPPGWRRRRPPGSRRPRATGAKR